MMTEDLMLDFLSSINDKKSKVFVLKTLNDGFFKFFKNYLLIF